MDKEKRFVGDVDNIDGVRVVQDYDDIYRAMQNGETVLHWEYGNSLAPLINNGEFCKIKPCVPAEVKRGDVVFCVLGGQYPMVHQVTEISNASYTGELWFKIGDTHDTTYGWTKEVYGIAVGTNIFYEEVKKWM